MPLTPTDVANKQFKIAFRGYALEEVDAFLDEVESELARLLRDNNDLKNRAPEQGGPAQAAKPAPAAAPPPPPAPAPTPEPARPLASSEGQEAALRTLLLAQRTADEAIAEAQAEAQQLVTSARAEAESTLTAARTEAEQTLAAARAEAEQTLTAARTEADETLTSARREADQTLTAARREADTTLGAAQQKAAGVDQEVASRIQAATGNLDQRRAQLEQHIEELRAFEREYRTRLKAYLETQLRDLTGRGGPDDDGGAGVPVGARTAAVGLTPGGAAGVGPAGPGEAGEQPSLRAVPPLGRPGGDRGQGDGSTPSGQ